MKNMLKADFKKIFSAKSIYVLLAIAILIPFVTSGLLSLIESLLSGTGLEAFPNIFSAAYLYSASFSPTNNVGIIVLITLVVLGANEFSQNTIRNKIIAGYPKPIIFLSSLIYNLVIMTLIMLTHTSATYLFNGVFNGFVASEFLDVFKYGVIGFSSLFVVYTLVTVLLFKFKNIVSPLLITFVSLIFINSVYSVLNSITAEEVDFTFLQHVFPIIRVLSPTMLINLESISISIETHLWWVDLLVNLVHVTWLTFLGIFVTKKTDFK